MRKSTVVFLVMSLALIGHNDTWSYPIADTVRYPLDSYIVGANHFGKYDLLDNNKWHLGDDTSATAGTNVFAIGNGIVRHAAYHAPEYDSNGNLIRPNYGGMYIIEHNVNGENVCVLYVHMNFATFTKSVGQEITKGEYLGQVGNRQQNGDFPVHFHFGIRKGAYPADPNEYIYRDWIFSGYTSEESVLNDWYDPLAFIATHSQAPGEVIFDYLDFTSVDGLNMVGDAYQLNDSLRLTEGTTWQTGAAWYGQKVLIESGFETIFDFWISGDGADGFAFVLQNFSDIALGFSGAGLGYQDVPNSLAVEFDTWRNYPGDQGFTTGDVNENHVGVHTMGLEPNSAGPHAAWPDALSGETTAIPFLSDAHIHTAKIAYVPGWLAVYVDDLITPVLEVSIDIPSLLELDNGAAWVGFTGSTGMIVEAHDILNWTFTANDLVLQPDLTATVNVSSFNLHAGETATVSGTVENGPDADAVASQLTVNFGTQTQTVDVPAIPAGGYFPYSVDFVLGAEGLQIVQAIADSGDAVTEGDEGNNVAQTIVVVLPPLQPDLVVDLLTAYKQKGKIIIDVELGNIGTASAGGFALQLEILENGATATASFASLAEGVSTTARFSFKKVPRKFFTFWATVDFGNQVLELDEGNNDLEGQYVR